MNTFSSFFIHPPKNHLSNLCTYLLGTSFHKDFDDSFHVHLQVSIGFENYLEEIDDILNKNYILQVFVCFHEEIEG